MPEILLITGGQIAAHDYDQSSTILAGILQRNGLSVQATHSADAAHDLSGYAALVLFTDGDFFDERGLASIISFVRQGGGLVSLHTTAGTNKSSEAFGKLIGSRILGGAVLEHNAIFRVALRGVEGAHLRCIQIDGVRVNPQTSGFALGEHAFVGFN